jgi:hypothetical protein
MCMKNARSSPYAGESLISLSFSASKNEHEPFHSSSLRAAHITHETPNRYRRVPSPAIGYFL